MSKGNCKSKHVVSDFWILKIRRLVEELLDDVVYDFEKTSVPSQST